MITKRDEKYVNIDVSTLEETRNGELKLNIKVDGERYDVESLNGADVKLDTDGHISVGFENGFSQLIIKDNDETKVDLFIIREANGNVTLDIDEKYISAGAEVDLALEDGKIVLGGAATVADAEEEKTYFEAEGRVEVLGNEIKTDEPKDTHIVKTIRSLISRIRKLF